MAISSPGIGSNLDVNGIVSKLMSVESQPLSRLNQKESDYQTQLSAYGTVTSAVSAFNGALTALRDPTKFNSLSASTSDGDILTATASSTAKKGTYSLTVSQLAEAQKLVAAGQSDETSSIGNGTITFDFGTITGTLNSTTQQYDAGATFTSNGNGTKTVTISSSNNSLSGIRDAINSAGIGVTATIVNDGGTSPYRLVLSSDNMGKTQSLKISVAGDAALSNLISNDPAGTQNLAETTTGKNAELKVNGISISKTSNNISDVIQGVTLNLLDTASTSQTVTVSSNTSGATSAVSALVKAYNDLDKAIRDVSSYDPSTKTAGPLLGDSVIRGISAQIRSAMVNSVPGATGNITALYQLGVSFQKDGTLSLDTSKLQDALSKNGTDVAALFAAVGKPTDSLVNYVSAGTNTAAGDYSLNVTTIATKGYAVGDTVAGLTITSGVNDAISVTADDHTATVKVAPGIYTSASSLALAVQSAINGSSTFSGAGVSVAVTEAAGILKVTSSSYGSDSKVNINSGNGKAGLFGNTTSTDGVDVAGTINGATATGSGQTLTSADGLKINILGGSTGYRGVVSFSRGYGYTLDKLTDNFLGSTGTLAGRKDGINSAIKDIGKQRDALNSRLADIQKRYLAQYTALDTLMSQMTQTSTYLTQQLASLPK